MREVDRRRFMQIASSAAAASLAFPHLTAAQQRQPQQPPKPPPALTRDPVNWRNWTMDLEVKCHGFQVKVRRFNDGLTLPQTTRFRLNRLAAVFPLLKQGSSMHTVYPQGIETALRVEGESIRNAHRHVRVVDGYQGPTSLVVWERADINTRLLTLGIKVPMTSFETRINEDIAFGVPWWTEKLNATLEANLKPQLFIDPTQEPVLNLAREWTNNHPKRASPYYLAKYLAGRVLEYYQPSGTILEGTGRGLTSFARGAVLVSGFRVFGSTYAAVEKRGSPLDLANLLCAVYRAVGLPSRVVIGYDKFLADQEKNPVVRAWVEFALVDERNERIEWIPVDILRQREFSNRMPPMKQRWEFFGHNEEFDFMIPIAFHWHPPTSVTNAGPPAFWGWIPDPANPIVDQEVRIFAMETPQRGDDGDDAPYRKPTRGK
jgi:transglutaminase-like putative cysteine protease